MTNRETNDILKKIENTIVNTADTISKFIYDLYNEQEETNFDTDRETLRSMFRDLDCVNEYFYELQYDLRYPNGLKGTDVPSEVVDAIGNLHSYIVELKYGTMNKN